jgi:hypothetical protein
VTRLDRHRRFMPGGETVPDDDRMLGQNEVDVRNEARREDQRGPVRMIEQETMFDHQEQTAICTNDERCQAAADGHDPDCPVEEQLKAEFKF